MLKINGFNILHIPLKNRIASVRAVCTNSGSLVETERDDWGVAHFLEHMFFKGTTKKTFKEIGRELDWLGSHNASTGYDHTKYFINCRTKHCADAFKILCELLFELKIDPEEVQKERSVILEEIQHRLDDPVGYFVDALITDSFGTHPIIGFTDTVANIKSKNLEKHRQVNYDKENLLFIIAGDIESVDKFCGEVLAPYADIVPTGTKRTVKPLPFNNKRLRVEHDAEQAIFSVSLPGFTEKESYEHNFVDLLFTHGFGGASSSLLFERIRQELGLCYFVTTSSHNIAERSMVSSFGLTAQKNVKTALDEIQNLFNIVKKEGFAADRLRIYKENIWHQLESTETAASYAASYGDETLVEPYHVTPEIMAKKIDEVTNNDIIDYVNFLSATDPKIATLND